MPRFTKAIHNGECADPNDNFLAAKASIELQLRAAQVASDLKKCEVAWSKLAVLCRNYGRNAEAASFQQMALKQSFAQLQARPSDFFSLHLSNLANDAIVAGDWQNAERLLLAALAINRQQKDLSAEGADWGSLGIVAAMQGHLGSAIKRFRRALSIHRKLQDDDAIGIDLRHLAEVALMTGDLNSAEELADRAIDHLQVNKIERLWQQALCTWREIKSRRRLTEFDPSRN